jgi:butyryl-CoA dehydrogenase
MTSSIYTEDERTIRETFHRFTEEQVKPRAQAIDDAKEFPRELFEQVGALGLFGMRYPATWGGTDTGTRPYLLAIEELARGSLSLAACCTMQSLMGTYFIFRSGNDDICTRFLVPAIKGERVGTICITEPDAGSDLDAIATRAVEDGDGWVLNGAKTWITSAPAADFFTVFAVTAEGERPRDRELSVFLVERDTDGLTVGKTIEKMGLWGSVTSEVNFDDCRVPVGNILGERGKGREYSPPRRWRWGSAKQPWPTRYSTPESASSSASRSGRTRRSRSSWPTAPPSWKPQGTSSCTPPGARTRGFPT